MSPAKKGKPDNMHSLTPMIVCAGAAQAIDFYKAAFGAVEETRLEHDGKILHASVRIGDSVLMLTDEMKDWGALGPNALGGTAVTIHVYVDDVDAAWDRVVKAGATVKMPLENTFWGDRYGVVIDPFGHSWSLATHLEDLTPDQIRENMLKAMPHAGC